MQGSARVVGVVGARGGAGVTTLAAALARRWAAADAGTAGRGTGVALVDLDGAGAGLDVHLGVEDGGGLRWPDLSGARGDVAGDELTALLPTWSGVTVLSGDRWRPGPAPPDVVADVLAALVTCHRALVLDLGRREVLDGGEPLHRCGTVLVAAARDVGSVAGVVALREALLGAVDDVRLVVGGPAPGGLGALEVAHAVDLPVAATLPVDRHLSAAVERGAGPVVRGRGRLARRLDRLAAELDGTPAPAGERRRG